MPDVFALVEIRPSAQPAVLMFLDDHDDAQAIAAELRAGGRNVLVRPWPQPSPG